jgi:hypothetical protein
LPFSIGDQTPPTGTSASITALWLVGRLTVVVGLPFFALSASAPLLQSWFTRTGHAAASDPYFLYGASNLGSLAALLAFPLAFEPLTTLSMQSRLWSLVFAALVFLVGACALAARQSAPLEESGIAPATDDIAVAQRWRSRLLWIALAFVPSSLLLGVTSYITTDVASAPLLWVIPLALYLLSFVVTFARRSVITMQRSLTGQAASFAIVILLFMMPTPPLSLVIPAHYLAFFFIALVCHGALAARRPTAARLTDFYFCLSLGGALGGVFNALIAPAVFSSTYEYPMTLILACALTAAVRPLVKFDKIDVLLPLALLAAVIGIIEGWGALSALAPVVPIAVLLLIAAAVFSLASRPLRFALAAAAVLVPTTLVRSNDGVLEQERSFFGVHRVKTDTALRMLGLVHGTTLHGTEFTDPARWRSPVLYYYSGGPVGQFFARLRAVHPGPQRIAAAGLGTGVMVCYAVPGEAWTFYEIDPVVVRVARDTRYFHYLEQCGAAAKIVLGDARLLLQAGPSHRYDVLILDAFSSDAIPMHLLTKEAIELYLDQLAPNGVMLLHISNRNLRLTPMLATLAGDLGLAARHELFQPSPTEEGEGAIASEWLAMARRQSDLAFLDGEPRWGEFSSTRHVTAWTDNFSNIVSVLKWCPR